jgi:hypothetical protein
MAIDRDVGVAVAATAAVLSPQAREVMRKGAVYGLVLKAGDVVFSTARGAARGAEQGVRTGSSNGSGSSSRSASSGSRSRSSGNRKSSSGGRRRSARSGS